MNPRTAIRKGTEKLSAAGVPDPTVDAAVLLAHVTGGEPLRLRLDTDTVLPAETLEAYENLLRCRAGREPLQYLTGEQSFLGHSFRVDRRVLIPRPETEWLALLAVELLKPMENPRMLDLCCGSGCIAVSAALALPRAEVHACDLSPDALAVAQSNAEALGARVCFHRGDLLEPVRALTFDLIVSNPPYIPTADCAQLQAEVQREPLMALDGGPDGLGFYRRIAAEAPALLNPGGTLLLELGDGEADAVCALLQNNFSLTALHPDLNGLPRIAQAKVKHD